MKWRQFYKVDQSVLTTYFEATGNRDKLTEFLDLPGIYYKYIDGMICFREKELRKFEAAIRKSPIALARKSMDMMIKLSDVFVDFCEKLSLEDHSKKSIQQLKEDYIRFCKAWEDLLGIATTPLFFETIVEEMLENELNKYVDPKNYDFYLTSLITLTKDTFSIMEKKELLKLAMSNKDIDEHLRKWAWVDMHLLIGQPASRESLTKRLEEARAKDPSKALERIELEKEKHQKNFDSVIKELPQLKELAEITQLIIYVRDYRYNVACKGCYFIRPFLTFLGEKIGISYEDIVQYTPEEVIRLIDDGEMVDSGVIEQRKKSFAIVTYPDKVVVSVGEEYEKIRKEESEEFGEINEFSGIIASKGIVKGTVKIVFSKSDLKKIHKGDILVAQQTIPSFVSSMEHASAIVTDLGGITSHAAIVSREFQIPCIVGTKIATKVLKDGMTIEVDADKGVVKVI